MLLHSYMAGNPPTVLVIAEWANFSGIPTSVGQLGPTSVVPTSVRGPTSVVPTPVGGTSLLVLAVIMLPGYQSSWS